MGSSAPLTHPSSFEARPMDTIPTEHSQPRRERRTSRLRLAAWAAAALVLLLPLVAMQITDQVDWTVGDFVFAAVFLFVPLGLYEIAARATGNGPYRIGVGVALAGAVAVVWIGGAVGITDSDADILYVLSLAIGAVGALVARFKAHGMARAMGATALALVLSGATAWVSGSVPAFNSAFEIAGLTGFFAALFVGSALLFREAAREPRRGEPTP